MTFENKAIAITGAGRATGRTTALHLAARGAKIVLGARQEAEIADEADSGLAPPNAGRAPAPTVTKLYVRTSDAITLDELGRIRI